MSLSHGFDVSAYNSDTVRKCDFAWIKASEGSGYTSGSFPAQWASAHVNASFRGGYHFARPEEGSAISQADRFIDIVRPVAGRDGLCLDLEASKLSQSATNTWARTFGDRLWDKAPGVTTALYAGSGYVTSTTGQDLAKHFNLWWYPQYPSAYQRKLKELSEEELARHLETEARQRADNRSHQVDGRTPIAAMTTAWPTAMTPWLPSGLTLGKAHPDIWQFSDNLSGEDASVTPLTAHQLATAGTPATTNTTQEINPWLW